MGNIFSIRLTDEDKVHLQQRMNETGKNATEVFIQNDKTVKSFMGLTVFCCGIVEFYLI